MLLPVIPVVLAGIIAFGFLQKSYGICPYCGDETSLNGKISGCDKCGNYIVNNDNSLSKINEDYVSDTPVFKVTISDINTLNNFSQLSPLAGVCCVCGNKALRTVLVVPDSMPAQFALVGGGISVPHCDLHNDGATCTGGQYKNRFNLFFRSYRYYLLVKNTIEQ